MSGSGSSRNKALLAGAVIGAVGAGALLAGTGLFLLKQHLEKKNLLLARNSERIGSPSSRNDSADSSDGSEDTYFSSGRSLPDDDSVYYDCLESFDSSVEPDFFEKVDKILESARPEKLKAFEMLDEKKAALSRDPQFLWRFAKAHQLKASWYGARRNLEEKEKYIIKGLEYAQKALSLDDSIGETHKWVAILQGMHAEFLPITEKLKTGRAFQKHLFKAIELLPEDYSLYHFLGRCKFEVAELSWVEKQLASAFLGDLAKATYEGAIEDFLKAENLNKKKDSKENKLFLAKCHIQKKNYLVATQWLKKAENLPVLNDEEDHALNTEINQLLKQYSK